MVQMKAEKLEYFLFLLENFISHMVQMKGIDKEGAVLEKINFISHMVQMKASICFKHGLCMRYFISHMVQMKVIRITNISILNLFLYIPHGSDERHFQCYCQSFQKSLYPTWFR